MDKTVLPLPLRQRNIPVFPRRPQGKRQGGAQIGSGRAHLTTTITSSITCHGQNCSSASSSTKKYPCFPASSARKEARWRSDRIRKSAPDYYDNLKYHMSWTKLFFRFLFDKEISLFSRVVRKERGKVALRSDPEERT